MSPARSDWAHTFEIPEKFSVATTAAVRKGQLTKNGRTDIVAAMYTRITGQKAVVLSGVPTTWNSEFTISLS